MHRRSFILKTSAAGIIAYFDPRKLLNEAVNLSVADLEERFANPDLSDHPMVYWFWMNGHISKEGITLDLEAMRRVGISGVFNFDAGISIPKGPVAYLSKEWLALKLHAIREAKRLGLEFVLHNCPGWSASGGPWITPELAMQQLTWSEMVINGGHNLSLQLPTPFHKSNFYRDIATLAYPSLPSERNLQTFHVLSSNGAVAKNVLTGEDPYGVHVYPAKSQEEAWLMFDFWKAQEVFFITFLISAVDTTGTETEGRTAIDLQTSDDGNMFKTIATISTGLASELALGYKLITYDIEPTKARFFRLRFKQARRFSQVRFSGYTRLKNFMEKTGNRFMFSGSDTSPIYTDSSDHKASDSAIDLSSVLDLSEHLDKDGLLECKLPEGSWTILRFGYTITGAINKAAPENGTGLECDKFSKDAIDFHFSEMMNRLGPSIKTLAFEGKMGLQIDSYEAGPQTWTKAFPNEFLQRHGYSIINYLPAMTGRILYSPEHTERFLWDYRRTQAELIAENYYGRFSALCKQHGFTCYVEPYDKGPFEEMQVGARAGVSMGEFWYGLHSLLPGNLAVERTARLAASITHINGRRIVAAESFTSEPESSRWQEYPFSLKALGDKMFCQGVNKMVIHRFAHQPNSYAKPGMTMGPWGIHFDRTNTWFEKAGGWLKYNARCQALLREGWPVKDLLYFTGEEANVFTKVQANELRPTPPEGYDYDLIDAATILRNVRIEGGLICLPYGTRYRILVLQDYQAVTLQLLHKLMQLVREGMVMAGGKPIHCLGLKDSSREEEFKRMADELWGTRFQGKSSGHSVGKGRTFWDTTLTRVLHDLSLVPDFTFSSLSGDAPILFVHRYVNGVDIYFISNQRRTYESLVCSFRVKDKEPEMWDAGNGSYTPMIFYEQQADRVQVPLQLEPYGSRFVIFRSEPAKQKFRSLEKDGNVLISTKPYRGQPRKLFLDVTNDFTIAVWAKPEMNIMTKPSEHMGNLAHPYTDHYAIYPSPGRDLYGEGHAVCGLAIGRNGVAVWESESHPALVLVAEAPITGWSQIVLVYNSGTPLVYIDGHLIKQGIKSRSIIHPGLGHVYRNEGASFYNGDMVSPKLYTKVLNRREIQLLAQKEEPPVVNFPAKPTVVSQKKKAALLFWENGKYKLEKADGEALAFTVNSIEKPVELSRNWSVAFPADSGAPQEIVLSKLQSLHTHKDAGVKYFSGTAIYRNQFTSNSHYEDGSKRLFLDLGGVEVVAQVTVNGKEVGLLWKRPYIVDISTAIRSGINKLEISVTNLWPNRLIGDEQIDDNRNSALAGISGFEHLAGTSFEKEIGQALQEIPAWYINGEPPPKNGPVAFATWKHYTKQDPLLESGLIGPVFIRTALVRIIEP